MFFYVNSSSNPWKCLLLGSAIESREKDWKLNQTQSTSSIPCVFRNSHLKGVKQSKGQEESQEEKKLEARNGEYNTRVGYSKVLEDP